jgi:hypothetical protein
MSWNPHANIIPKHKTMQQKIKNQCTSYCNAQSFYGASSTKKEMFSNLAYAREALLTWH